MINDLHYKYIISFTNHNETINEMGQNTVTRWTKTKLVWFASHTVDDTVKSSLINAQRKRLCWSRFYDDEECNTTFTLGQQVNVVVSSVFALMYICLKTTQSFCICGQMHRITLKRNEVQN